MSFFSCTTQPISMLFGRLIKHILENVYFKGEGSMLLSLIDMGKNNAKNVK